MYFHTPGSGLDTFHDVLRNPGRGLGRIHEALLSPGGGPGNMERIWAGGSGLGRIHEALLSPGSGADCLDRNSTTPRRLVLLVVVREREGRRSGCGKQWG